MTIELTFAWWWIGVAMIVIGVIVAAVAPDDGQSSFRLPGAAGCFGIFLAIAGVLYLIFGGIARLFL